MLDEITVTITTAAKRLDLFLSIQTGQSRAFIKYQIEKGNVFLNGTKVEKPSQSIKVGDEVKAKFESEQRMSLEPIEKKLDILFEDESLLVLNKPQGWVVHPAAGHRGETLVHYLLHYLQQSPGFSESSLVRPGIVHRLDRGTTGCIVIAKNRSVLEKLAFQFKERHVQKEYEAIAWGKMKPSGSFRTCIGRHPIDRKRMSSKSLEGKVAETRWECYSKFSHFSHVHLFPKTGRTHQIRVHLSEGGHTIVGDSLYGKRMRKIEHLHPEIQSAMTSVKFPFLHAKAITFEHPVTAKEIKIIAPTPAVFASFLKVLARDLP